MRTEIIINDDYVRSRLAGNLQALRMEGRRLLKPVSNITVSDWAEKNLYLPEGSAEPGRFSIRRAPHIRGILDCVNDPNVNRITLTGSAQIAKTTVLQAIIGYHIDVDPKHIIMILPTDELAADFSTQKLEPMINATPSLRTKVSKNGGQKKGNSTLRKKFVGGFLTLKGGNSPNAYRFISAPLTIADDYDGIPLNVREGDPEAKLTKRSTTYHDALNITSSTPTRAGSSRIWKLYEQSNMMRYHVRCPHCNEMYYLKHERLQWDKDIDAFDKVINQYPATARYACDGCGVLLTEGERRDMLDKGVWVADKPFVKKHVGFWINELSSKLSSMEKVAQQIIAASDDQDKLEVLYNTVYGLPFKPNAGKEIDPIALINNRTNYMDKDDLKIPNAVLLLTASADVQEGTKEKPQRLEVNIWGWGAGEEGWLICRYIIPGNVVDDYAGTWGKLDAVLERTYYRHDGVPLRIARTAVDSGDNTQSVYDYVRMRFEEGIIAVKGANRYYAPMIAKSFSVVDRGSVNLLLIGTQIVKEEIFARLETVKNAGPKYTHFPEAYCDEEYFRQLTSEHKVTKYVGNTQYQIFEKKHKSMANEALDLFVYAFAIMKSLYPNWEQLKLGIEHYKEMNKKTERVVATEQVVADTVKRRPQARATSSFVNRFRG